MILHSYLGSVDYVPMLRWTGIVSSINFLVIASEDKLDRLKKEKIAKNK